MIATMRVLGLKARNFTTIAGAARRIVRYLEGSGVSPRSSLGGYYGGSGRLAQGWARGNGAGLVGLSKSVGPKQLQRLLEGRHAVTGAPLLSPRGSAGRFHASHGEIQTQLVDAPAVLTLAEAARRADVSATYLRRLAEDHELESSAAARTRSVGAAVVGDPRLGPERLAPKDIEPSVTRDYLRAYRDSRGRRWLVERDEVARFIRERQPPTVVIGYDLTCSAPKSVSLLWAFGDQALRNDVSAALDAGVDAAITYLEQHAVVGTVGRRNQPGLGLAAASYRHEISRSEEAHLHVHTIIVNAVPIPLLDSSGRPVLDEHAVARIEWRALDGEVLLRHVKTAGYVGAAALRHHLARRRGLSWGPVRNGVSELRGFPAELLDAFSTRRGELTQEFTQLVESGLPANAETMATAQRESRAAKRVLSDPQVEAIQRQKLKEAGWSVEQIRRLGAQRERDLTVPTRSEVEALFNTLVGPTGLTQLNAIFGQREVVQAVAAWAEDRLEPEAITRLAQEFLADPRIVLLETQRRRRRNQDEQTYTTSDLLAVEQTLIRLYWQGRVDHGGPPRAQVSPEVGQAAIQAVNERLRADLPTGETVGLSGEQCDLVQSLLRSADLVRLVIGPAGTGKTEAMHAVVQAFTSAGHTVLGTANGGRQAQDLHERLGIRTQVIAGWLTLLNHTEDPAQVWTPGTVLIVDEATQISTRDGERLLRYATRSGTVVILIGDAPQLGSVGAGGWFSHLIQITPEVPGLTLNQRQRGDRMLQVRLALAALREHTPQADREALLRLAADGRVEVFDHREDLLDAIVTDWYTERSSRHTPEEVTAGRRVPARPGGSHMMAEHHRDTDLLNHAARERLTGDGTLSGPVLRVARRDFQTGDEVLTLTQAGHTLVPAGRPRSEYIRTGSTGVVTAVHLDPFNPARQFLTVMFPGRGEVRVDWAYLTHAFPDGRDGGLTHAYAQTAHKAEGSTMDTARPAVTDDTSRAGLYVMLSRPRHDLRAYIIRRTDLHADLDDEDWLPILSGSSGPMRSLLENLAESGTERLAGEHDPVAQAAHELTRKLSLAELTHRRRAAARALREASRTGSGTRPTADEFLIARRAEIAAEVATGHAVLADPDPRLLARIGARPRTGSDRVVWDRAVTALAVLHARSPSENPRHQLPEMQADSGDEIEHDWHDQRAAAEQIADSWAQLTGQRRHERFHSKEETVPRNRAITAIHALIAHGWSAERISIALTADDTGDVRTAAAVLEYRVNELLETTGITATAFELPPAMAPTDEWEHVRLLLKAAETHHLAEASTGDLAAEHHELTQFLALAPDDRGRSASHHRQARERRRALTLVAVEQVQSAQRDLEIARSSRQQHKRERGAAEHALERARQHLADRQHAEDLAAVWENALTADASSALEELRTRLGLVDAALARQIDHAALALRQHPASYLTGFLGYRPTDPQGAARWNQRAITIEHYRHHVLGLPYGQPAAPAGAPASEQALGTRPTDPTALALYERVRSAQQTLDLGSNF